MYADSDELDPREFLEQLRQSLQTENSQSEGELPGLLARYGRLCEAANQRLRECHALIQRGHYSNAIALADREPNLLDLCSLLLIPECESLESFARLLGVRAPALINRDLVGAVQDAYEKGSTAAENLALLHRLNLARAPLPSRLAVMRSLLKRNPNHPHLEADIRTFERAWFKQAVNFVQPFIKDAKPECIQEVMRELEQGPYLEPIPASLIAGLKQQLAKAQASQLPALAAEIRKAFTARSVWSLVQLGERWENVIAVTGRPPVEVSFGVAEALEWSTSALTQDLREREKDEATAHLARSIGAPSIKRSDLESVYSDAKSMGAVDDVLEGQFRSRLASIDRRRKMLVIGSAAAVAIIIASTILGIALTAGSTGTDRSKETHAGQITVPTAEPRVNEPKPREIPRLDAAPLSRAPEAAPRESGKLESSERFAEEFGALRKQIAREKVTSASLERLAGFLSDRIAPVASNPELASRARLARKDLPIWIKILGLQTALQSGAFLTQPINDGEWAGKPPAGLLAAASEYVEMLRQRNPAASGSDAAKLKNRLAENDIVNLWLIRPRGQEDSRYYTKKQPAPGQEKLEVNVLMDNGGREEPVPFQGPRVVMEAPQSSFAERAVTLWEPLTPDEWNARLAKVCDDLLENSAGMDPILKLSLLRRLLNLAVTTSIGYRHLLEQNAGFKAVTGRSGLITGNWINPGEDLESERNQASDLIKQSPRLSPLAATATAGDKERLAALKHGLVVAGWIDLTSEGRPVIARFSGADPVADCDLFMVINGQWIKVGGVSADGKEIGKNTAASDHAGWPVFAVQTQP
jgi:hypothetical protein